MFKLSIQRAEHHRNESETMMVGGHEALKIFDDFDWASEMSKADELKRVSPTISLEKDESLIWVSGCDGLNTLISECGFPGVVRKWFGLSKGPGMVALYTERFSVNQARKALQLFINEAHEELQNLYRK